MRGALEGVDPNTGGLSQCVGTEGGLAGCGPDFEGIFEFPV